MIRILFILLAVMAAVLALLLQQPLLYGLAAALLVVALILVVASLQRRQKRQQKQASEPPAARPKAAPAASDDLTSLGILEIRPKGSKAMHLSAPPADEGGEEVAAPAVATSERPERSDRPEKPATGSDLNGSRPSPATSPLPGSASPLVGRSGQREKLPIHAVDAGAEAPHAAVLLPYLQTLRAALDAQTVCLLRQEEMGLRYHIEAILSQNAYARSGGTFTTAAPLLNASEARRPTTVRRVGESGIPQINLGYYREAIAVRQVAMAPVPRQHDETLYFLLADTMQEGALGTPHRRAMLAEFAHLLGTILDTPSQEALSGEPEQLRPRRDIIAEEMEKARAHRRSLALALVYLNEAEARADEGPEAVATSEKALEAHLRKATRQGRVERFGELTFGVFYTGTAADVEGWAMQLQNELAHASGPLEGGVSIGIAMLQDRHRDPDAFRGAATTALGEAFETGECVIVE